MSFSKDLLRVLSYFAKQSLANRRYQVELGNEQISLFLNALRHVLVDQPSELAEEFIPAG